MQPFNKEPEAGGVQYSLNQHMKPAPKRRWPWVVAGLTVVMLAAIGGSIFWYFEALKAPAASAKPELFTVKSGDSASAIAGRLHQQGLIRDTLAFQIALRLSGKAGNIKAGSYRLAASENATDIMEKLESGKVDVVNLQISPGITLDMVKTQFVGIGFRKDAVDAAFTKRYEHPLLKDRPGTATLEGYVFPDTYRIQLDEGPEVALKQVFDTFYKKLTAENAIDGAKARGLNLHQLVTLASIIEKEVSSAEDQAHVAQVFLKRMKEDMALGSDVTYMYAAKLMGVKATPELQSPYNTRLVKGLPPGPIANTRLGAIKAVLNPTPTEDLYFVAGDNGITYFSKTLAEHEANVSAHCQLGCQ
ncbi:endolytic transglycosylase MltG [Candidatus Saccharibacteria bacterium]|nr:endolytic transglycosylase MltG [Candidatus Saccharibacteria bacterium]